MGISFPHILIVDDDNTIRGVVKDMLIQMGLEVSSAENGEKGMDLCRNNKFDLVITDFDMPGMNGIDFANEINRKSPSTLIVLMTGYDKEFILSRIKDTNVGQVLFKPFTLTEMAETIQGLLHH